MRPGFPDRVAAFVVNKGNFYYTGVASKAARDVPALLFVGASDLPYRINAVTGIFAINRRPGGSGRWCRNPTRPMPWAVRMRCRVCFFDDVLPMRIGAMSGGKLGALDPDKGWLGDLDKKTVSAPAIGLLVEDRQVCLSVVASTPRGRREIIREEQPCEDGDQAAVLERLLAPWTGPKRSPNQKKSSRSKHPGRTDGSRWPCPNRASSRPSSPSPVQTAPPLRRHSSWRRRKPPTCGLKNE